MNFCKFKVNSSLCLQLRAGLVIVCELVDHGYFDALVDAGLKVVALARRKEKMEALAQQWEGKTGKLYPIQTDISKEEDILKAFEWVKNNLGPLHILINNAGMGRYMPLTEADTQSLKEVLTTNVVGLSIATREAVKDMRENGVDGHIVHMNSVFGHKVPMFPGMNMYPASKFAITALTETLRLELNTIGSKIKITSISPGVVATEIWETSGVTADKDRAKLLQSLAKLEPEDVADAVVYALSTPPHVQVHELTIKPVGELF